MRRASCALRSRWGSAIGRTRANDLVSPLKRKAVARGFVGNQRRAFTPSRPAWQLDLDDLLQKNKYGASGDQHKPALDVIMDKGNHYEMLKDEVNVSPEYPYDVDVGPLICRKMNRCFLAGGELCGEYQQGNRQKGMLQDINSALNEGGFFFIFNTMITEAQLNDTYEHMAAMFKESETALGIDAPSPSGRGFSRRGIHSAEPGVIAEHLCFSFGKDHDLREPNLWPADIIRPGFKKDVSELFNELDFISDMLAK
ncbi:hypothetical protein GUITHDRAFT_164618, partial [Guillardia theta CCMP2712]